MSRNGKRIIRALRGFARDVDAGRPVTVSVVRRMRVKGETVFTRETYNAPLGRKGGKQ